MADTTKIWPIFRWANWWLSDDLFTGIKNSFYYSNDMEIREDAKSAYPMWVPAYADANVWKNVWDWTGNNSIVKSVTYSQTESGWIICLRNNIYLLNSSNTVSSLCSFSEEICDLEIFNWYIYVSTKQHLYYKKDNWDDWANMAASTTASSLTYGRCADALSNNKNHQLYASDNILAVSDKNKVKMVTRETPNLLQEWLTLQDWYVVRFINELGWFLRVVAVDEPYWSEVLLWDKVNNYPQETIPLEWYSILWAIVYNWYQYLLSNKWLWLLNWYQYYLLKKAETYVTTDIRNNMCVYDDKLFFVANDWIYIYWWKNKNYPDVLNLWHKLEDWYDLWLWAIWSYTGWIMITRNRKYEWGTYYPVRVWVNTWLATTWTMETMCYFGSAMSEIKQSAYLRVGYHLWKQWEESWNIHIYYRTEADAIDDDPSHWERHDVTKPEWLYADWDMRSPFATTLKLNCRFQWIQFKFVLTNCVWTDDAWTHTKDTNLYSADLYYNVMLD